MVRLANIFASIGAATLALANISLADVSAHGPTEADIAAHRQLTANAKHSLGQCAGSENMRKLQERAAARRLATINHARRQRRLALDDFLATDHRSNTSVTADTSASELFGDEVSCILQPEVTYGPYYIDGELIRTDVRESQTGIDFYFDLQVIDVETCEPVPDVYFDFWHCNTTGVYAGVVADGNGDSSDASNINTTFFRGVYPTDEDGVVQFVSKFPGHYTGRATHIHLLGNYGGTVLENGTYAGGYIPHVGQFFFDQDLLTEVYATADYVENTDELTLNADDTWLAVVSADDYDSLVEYALLGDSVEDGIFGWISVAINVSASQDVSPAGWWTENGGVMSDTPFSGGGGGDFGGSFGGGFGSAGGFPGSAGGDFAGKTGVTTASTSGSA